MQIPNYTQGLVKERAVADTVNLGLIGAAGAVAKGVAEVADIGVQITKKIKETNDLTVVNSAVIKKQKDDLDFNAQSQKDNESNPIGYAGRQFDVMKKNTDDVAGTLENEEQKAAFKSTSEKYNLAQHERNINWENTRATQMFANRADVAAENIASLAYRGEIPIDELRRNISATAISLGSVYAPDQIAKFSQQKNSAMVQSYLDGQIDRDPYEAKNLLDSKQFDKDLGDRLNSSYDKVNAGIDRLESQTRVAEEKYRKDFIEDPAILAENAGISLDNYQGKIEYQKNAGVADGNISIISNRRAAFIVNQLEGAKDSDQFIMQLNELRQDVGDDNYDMAMKDLKKAKLSDDLSLMVLMNPERDKRLMGASFEMAKDGDAITKKATARVGITTAKINDAVAEKLTETLDVLSSEGGQSRTAKMQKSMASMATFFVAQGKEIDEAADMATSWMNSQVQTEEINGKLFRTPNIARPSDIADAMEDAINNTEFSNIPFENSFQKRTVRPVLANDEKRYYLLNEIGLPVTGKDKKVIQYDIVEILKAREEKRRILQDKKSQEAFTDTLGD